MASSPLPLIDPDGGGPSIGQDADEQANEDPDACPDRDPEREFFAKQQAEDESQATTDP